MSKKIAIVVFADPGTEEALGRVFNAMFVAFELKEKKQDVVLIFQGTGVRWGSELVREDHPAHALYNTISDKVAGVCGGCADVFGATEALDAVDANLIREKEIPGTSGIIDLSKYLDDGYDLLTF